MPWAVFCDESGDVGFDLAAGATPLYVVTHLLIKTSDLPQLRELISKFKRKYLSLKKKLQWKYLSPTTKTDDQALSSFLHEMRTSLTTPIICSLIVDKTELLKQPSSLTAPQMHTLTPYSHGLCLKRELFFLRKTQGGFFIIDRNSNQKMDEIIRDYLVNVVPSHYLTDFPKNYQYPITASPKDQPGLQLADFIAGVTAASFSAYKAQVHPCCQLCRLPIAGCLYDCNVPYAYRQTYQELWHWYNQVFSSWSWRGLMYYPYAVRDTAVVQPYFPKK